MNWNELIGRRLGLYAQYTILEEIGRGGSSRVYRASDTALGRDVAIKVIPNDAEDRIGFVRRFEREVQAVAQLNHPNIVSVYDRGETDDVVFLVMECLLGGTLKQQMGRPLPTAEATAAIVQMAWALHHAHQRGIVHRDVKPSNMLVDAANTHHLLLTDFGIAKLQGARGLTKSGTTIGTPEYMAPEQAEGKEIDPRADVYALGCVLYETLSGRPPFVGSTPVSVLYQQVHSRPAYIRGFNPDVPRELARVIEQALAKRPEERFGTADLLADALLPYSGGLVESSGYLMDAPPSAPATAPASPASPASPAPPRRPSTPTPSRRVPSAPATPASPASPQPPSRPAYDPDLYAPPTPPVTPPVGPAAGDQWFLSQLPRPSSPLADHSTTGGLGEEGLDALFSHDDSAPPGPPGPGSPGPGSPGAPSGVQPPPLGRAPTSSGRLTGAPIPLPNFRLPAKTRPLSQPLTGNGQLDIDQLLRQEQESAQQYQPGRPGDYGSRARTTGGREPVEQSGQYMPGGYAARPPRAERGPRSGALNDDNGEPATALRRALLASGKPRQPQTVWRPDSGELTGAARTRRARTSVAPVAPVVRRRRPARQKRRPFWIGAVAAAVVIVAVAGWIAITGSGLGFTQRARVTPVATSTLVPTAVPTSTPQPSPTGTATVSPQQLANREAASSFAGVTLTRFVDRSCAGANSTSHFAPGEAVYVDLCVASQPAATSMTVAIRQHGAVLYTMASGWSVSPGSSYWFARYGLSSGTYDLLVTMPINGVTAVARDVTFTVG